MRPRKRVTLLCGHYGSGKTNIAVNLALQSKADIERLAVADLDIVNPYYRANDSREALTQAGIRMICSDYANSNLDIPALPQDMYAITDDKGLTVIADIGGDDRGALVLGRLAPALLAENDYDMLLVINRYRPLTQTVDLCLEVMAEITQAGGIPFTGIVNNSNLGYETTAQDVLASLPYVREVSRRTGLPIVATAVRKDLLQDLAGQIEDLLPLTLQQNFV